MSRTITLPALKQPHFEVQARLDGVTYTLEFRFNVRAGAWFLNILDAEALVVIYAGIQLGVDFPLAPWSRPSILQLPPGSLILVDTAGKHLPPDFLALGSTCLLLYQTAAELAA